MATTLKQVYKVSKYIIGQRIKGHKRFPLVLMLEPLFRCNLACPGCGKIQYPADILRKNLSPEQCFNAVEECQAPVVSVAGGEPLVHPQIDVIVQGLVDRKKFVYLCTNAILLEKYLHKFKPSSYLTISVHLDGLEKIHDHAVDRKGVFEQAIKAIIAAKKAGFRVTTNTTVFDNVKAEDMVQMFNFLSSLEIDGMMISPGYSYEKAPDQDNFLKRDKTKKLFSEIFAHGRNGSKPKKPWNFNHSYLYLEFLQGKHDYDCTAWGNPNYSVLGWQRPCYLMAEGEYAKTYQDLLEKTEWSNYGHKSANPKCTDCMVHAGYEPSAVTDSMSSISKMTKSLLAALGLKRPY
ncbi:MAG: adenosyl-hopene transferase HpnH [Chlamydiota bacterium]|nr:adenosyl-hopene transferase HpnH [Chlamydiota bacterium]